MRVLASGPVRERVQEPFRREPVGNRARPQTLEKKRPADDRAATVRSDPAGCAADLACTSRDRTLAGLPTHHRLDRDTAIVPGPRGRVDGKGDEQPRQWR